MAKNKSKLKSITQTAKVFEFKVTLLGTTPAVWRTFLAHDFIELSELHLLIQMTMGWEARHLYEFKINGKSYGELDPDIEEDMIEAEGTTLSEVINNSKNFQYIYDFGDGWQHKVEIVKTLRHDFRMKYPVCTGGENACPPEDCGGSAGFNNLKKTLAGKESDKKNELLTWLNGFYNPNTFDPNFINRSLLWDDIE